MCVYIVVCVEENWTRVEEETELNLMNVTDLNNDTVYHICVIAINGVGNETMSDCKVVKVGIKEGGFHRC